MTRATAAALLLLLLVAAAAALCARAQFTADTQTSLLLDAQGRVRIFHGMNVIYKLAPFLPVTDHFDPQRSLCEEDLQNMQAWGFNAVRLYVAWPGVQPAPGVINSTYLASLKALVQDLNAHDIAVLLDCHQDVYSPFFCGEGAPDHAVHYGQSDLAFPQPVLPDAFPVDQHGYPYLNTCLSHGFFSYYGAETVGEAFQSLYSNTNSIQDYFVAFWEAVAKTFVDVPLLGYEIINEPWIGDQYSHLDLLEPGVADRVNLQPMYDRVATAIRQYDPNHLVFFEPTTFDSGFFQTGFEHVPGGDAYRNASVLSWHVYCPKVNASGWVDRALCDEYDMHAFSERRKDLARLQTGSFITEFGALPNTTGAMDEFDFILDLADEFLQSWMYWQYKLYDDITTQSQAESLYAGDGSVEMNKLKTLSRTYATAIAGKVISMTFDTSSAAFQLVYVTTAASANADTEIYYNGPLFYPNGIKLSVNSPDALYRVDKYTIFVSAGLLPVGSTVIVKVQTA